MALHQHQVVTLNIKVKAHKNKDGRPPKPMDEVADEIEAALEDTEVLDIASGTRYTLEVIACEAVFNIQHSEGND